LIEEVRWKWERRKEEKQERRFISWFGRRNFRRFDDPPEMKLCRGEKR